MHIDCPHCHNPIELVEQAAAEEVLCPACGSAFRLEDEAGPARALRKGRPYLGKFEVLAIIGTGAFGTVYKARDPELDRVVAIKMPRGGNLNGGPDLERFLREARSVAQLRHPAIVPVYEVGKEDGVPYLVSEFIQGKNLADQLQERRPTFQETARLLADVADGLHYAHTQGIVHRDIKPSNIMLEVGGVVSGEKQGADHAPLTAHYSPRIMDFGMAKRQAGEVAMTIEGLVLGTPAYMSPEQARGAAHQVDARSDVYSLGVVLYELLSGERPFRGIARVLLHQVLHDYPRSPRSLNDRIPKDLEAVCLKAMAKEPGRRYQTAAELADDLRRFLDGQPTLARPVGRLERLRRWCKRNPALATAGSVTAAALLAVAILSTVFAFAEARSARRLAAALEETERQRRAAALLSANLGLDQGIALCEKNEVPRGMLLLARCLELAPADAHDLQRVIRANLAGWRRRLHPLRGLLDQLDPLDSHSHAKRGSGAAFSPDGRSVLTGSKEGTARLWDVTTGQPRGQSFRHDGPVHAVAFSSDGHTVLTGGGDQTARLWEMASGKQIGEPLRHTGPVWAVAFGPNGKVVLTGSQDQTARLWDAATGKQIGPSQPNQGAVVAVAFSPDGKTALAQAENQFARLWKVDTGDLIPLPQHNVMAAAFHPDSRVLLTAGADKTARLWDAASGEPLGQPLQHQAAVWSVAFSPDGKTLLTGTADGIVSFWDVATRNRARELPPQLSAIEVVAFSPDGTTVVTGCLDRFARLWDVATGAALEPALQHQSTVWGALFSPDGRLLLTRSQSDPVRLWQVNRGLPGDALLPHDHAVGAVAFYPGGRILLTGGGRNPLRAEPGALRLWNASTRKPLGEPISQPYVVMALAFSPDGTRLLIGSGYPPLGFLGGAGEAQVWETASRKLLWKQSQPGPILAVAISSDGRTALTESLPNNGQLWDVATGKLLRSLPHLAGAFSPDGKLVVTCDNRGVVQFWERATGQLMGPPLANHSLVIGGPSAPTARNC